MNKQTSAPVMISAIKNAALLVDEPNVATMERCKVATDAATSAYLIWRSTAKSGNERFACFIAQAMAAAIL